MKVVAVSFHIQRDAPNFLGRELSQMTSGRQDLYTYCARFFPLGHTEVKILHE